MRAQGNRTDFPSKKCRVFVPMCVKYGICADVCRITVKMLVKNSFIAIKQVENVVKNRLKM